MVKMLVPTAGQTTAVNTADYAMQIAKSIGAVVDVLHIVRNGGAREAGELTLQYFEEAGKENEVPVDCHFREGSVIGQIVEFAEENSIDLIVMGASRGHVVEQWISSDVRGSTTIPVLVIPYQIFD